MSILCISESDTFWPNFSWTEFATMPDKENALVILPVCGMSDWGLGYPLDSEETVAMCVLKSSLTADEKDLPVLITPPFRFALGTSGSSVFKTEPETAHNALEEWLASIKASGFRKVVIYNSSPWNEDLVDAAARDARIDLGLQMFCINLAGLGLDFHPSRSGSRSELQILLAYLHDQDPAITDLPALETPCPMIMGDETLRAEPTSPDILSKAKEAGPKYLNEAGAHLLGLLMEIAEREPLPEDGAVRVNRVL